MRKVLMIVMGAGLLAGCGSDRHAPPPAPTQAQIAATNATTACLVQHAKMYDDGKMHPRNLAKLIEPTCVAEFEREGVDSKRDRREDALRAVYLERNQQRQTGMLPSPQRSY